MPYCIGCIEKSVHFGYDSTNQINSESLFHFLFTDFLVIYIALILFDTEVLQELKRVGYTHHTMSL